MFRWGCFVFNVRLRDHLHGLGRPSPRSVDGGRWLVFMWEVRKSARGDGNDWWGQQ